MNEHEQPGADDAQAMDGAEPAQDVTGPAIPDEPTGETAEAPLVVELRRNTRLSAVVTGLAALLTLAYLVRVLSGPSLLDVVVLLVVLAVGATHVMTLIDGRTPLLVADAQGVRVRDGRTWQGFPWSELQAVEVLPRASWWKDGSLDVLPATGDPIALRLGAATMVSGLLPRHRDLVDALAELSAGRCDVAEIEGYEYVDPDEWAAGQQAHSHEHADGYGEDLDDHLGSEGEEDHRFVEPPVEPAATAAATTAAAAFETAGAWDDAPVEDAPVEDVAVEDVAVEDAPVEDVPDDASVEEVWDDDAPTGEIPALSDVPLGESDAPSFAPASEPRTWDPLTDPLDEDPRAAASSPAPAGVGSVPASRNPFSDAMHRMSALLPGLPGLSALSGLGRGHRETAGPAQPVVEAAGPAPASTRPAVAGVRSDVVTRHPASETGVRVGGHGDGDVTVFGANALKLDAGERSADEARPSLPEARELRRPGSVDLVEDTSTWGDRVRPIAREGHPVDPIVWDDEEHPAAEPVIGPELAAARTRLGLSVDQLADRTRVRPHVIEAMEVDDFAPCGGDFYARGHLRTLGRVLGIDAAPLVALYDSHYAHAPVSPQRVFGVDPAARPHRFSSPGSPRWSVLVAAVMALVLAWSIARLVVDGGADPAQDVPTLATSSATTGARTTVVLTAAGGGAHVVVRDGSNELVFRGNLAFGEVETLDKVSQPVRIRTTDGSLEVSVGGVDQGAMGRTGHAAEDTYTAG
ncbi:helix-turn-helix transcriptional regulator [Nocardioides sp. GY 10127]|uniref:helix-turn-helix domain-containing protein n=1 Tax=Nocardioides sp. GY 10127 TaxID=2569762 RepID=UPI0010A7839C|nr:helix-turn-helix transcriptional regulator [Nocardioides sp. GY 10127]TIC85572.1 helix-turn-helix domain-containing protein [Nocardioides sp. GY 10127]